MNAQRLLKLAEHLEIGELGHKKFDFGVLNGGFDENIAGGRCGTIGCALGECPILWPKDWEFNARLSTPVLLESESSCSFVDASTWFDIAWVDASCLFEPLRFRYWAPKLKNNRLSCTSSRKAVARSIRQFVKFHQENPDYHKQATAT